MKIALYKRQLELFNFIANYMQINNRAPTLEEMRKSLNLSSLATIHEHLSALEFKGVLRRTGAYKRGYELVYNMTERELLDNMESICTQLLSGPILSSRRRKLFQATLEEIVKRKKASL